MTKFIKRLFCVGLIVLLQSAALTSVIAADTAASEEKERVPIRYGVTPTATSGKPTIVEAFTEMAVATIEDGRPVALVSVSGSEGAITQIVDLNTQKILRSFRLKHTDYTYQGLLRMRELFIIQSEYIFTDMIRELRRLSILHQHLHIKAAIAQ